MRDKRCLSKNQTSRGTVTNRAVLRTSCHSAENILLIRSDAVFSQMEFVTLVCNNQHAHRAEAAVYFTSAQRQVLGGNSTKLAHLVTITSHIYTV